MPGKTINIHGVETGLLARLRKISILVALRSGTLGGDELSLRAIIGRGEASIILTLTALLTLAPLVPQGGLLQSWGSVCSP